MKKIIFIFTLMFIDLFGIEIIDLKNSKTLNYQEFMQEISNYKFILLGEFHDNFYHHELRSKIIKSFDANKTTVIAEHFDFGKKIDPDTDILKSLKEAGFDEIGWQWPIHQKLFESIINSKIDFIGGNLPKNKKPQNISELEKLIAQTPLDQNATNALEDDLIVGHCNMISKKQTKPMKIIQMQKDASMAIALTKFQRDINFLIAGNGHIQKNYGIPRLLNHLNPNQKNISVGFFGTNQFDKKELENYSKLWDFAILTQDVEQEDMCAKFKNKMEK